MIDRMIEMSRQSTFAQRRLLDWQVRAEDHSSSVLDGEIDNHYKRITALSQAAAASIALFQRCCRFEAVSLQRAVANSENELIARK